MMRSELKRGSVVRSLKGRDKDKLFAVMGTDERFIYIADGKERRTAQPKPKNPKHIESVEMNIDESNLIFDGRLRKAINRMKTIN